MTDLVLISFSKHELHEMIKSIVSEAMGTSATLPTSGKEKLLSAEEAATFLRIPQSTLYSYTSKRLIPHYKRGKRLVFKQNDLELWMSESRKKTVSEIEAELSSPQNRRGGKRL